VKENKEKETNSGGELPKIKPPTFNGEVKTGEEAES